MQGYTKEELEKLMKDPLTTFLFNTLGVDLNQVFDAANEIVENSRNETANTVEPTEVEEEIVSENKFSITPEQFETFVKDYDELLRQVKKLEYLFGIGLETSRSNGFSFSEQVNKVIWGLIRGVFGDENADRIAGYVFDNSPCIAPKDFYKQLD